MADMTVSAQFLMRNDTAAQWTSINPVLAKGELGVESDTNKFKFGDGTKKWTELPYASAQSALEKTADPTKDDKGFDIGTSWVNTTTKATFIYLGTDGDKAIWRKTVTLGTDGKIDSSYLPPLAISQPFVVANEAAMLALEAETGDIAIRSDISKCFILREAPATELSNWLEMLVPASAVLSVNGKTGAVTLNTDDVAEGDTNQYFTEDRATANFNTNVPKTSIRDFKDGADVVMKGDTLVLDGGNASGHTGV